MSTYEYDELDVGHMLWATNVLLFYDCMGCGHCGCGGRILESSL